jgi:hypothetical protein
VPEWLAATLPLVGVALGIVGANSQDARRWRRDWYVSQVNIRREHYGALLEALYAQHLLLQQAPHRNLDLQRIETVDNNWRSRLVQSVTLASHDVQLAVGAYDQVRNATVEAINTKNPDAVTNSLAELEEARLVVLGAINEDIDDLNEGLSYHFLTRWQRLRGVQPPKSIPIPLGREIDLRDNSGTVGS